MIRPRMDVNIRRVRLGLWLLQSPVTSQGQGTPVNLRFQGLERFRTRAAHGARLGDSASPSPGAADSALVRRPALLPFGFGLLHGLGFAGALTAAGLPQHALVLSLFSFNVGIELGQLVFVVAVLLVRPVARALAEKGPGWLARVPAYTMGSLAAFWCYQRFFGIF